MRSSPLISASSCISLTPKAIRLSFGRKWGISMKLRSTYGWLAAMLWLHACPVHAQEQAFPVKYHFNWKKVEQHVPASVVDQFIKGKPAEFEFFRRGVDKYHSANLDTLATRLHFLDLNGDGRLDIIFHGESGGEGKLLLIFMNVGGKYKR